jgi:transcriptional regulator with XRE-family HTH domain
MFSSESFLKKSNKFIRIDKMETIINEIVKIIKENDISQYKLAKELNISQSYLNEMLNGKKKLNINYLIKICNYLKYEIIFRKKS